MREIIVLSVALVLANSASAQEDPSLDETEEGSSARARGGLAALQLAHGLGLGAELCAALDCDEPVFVSVVLLGGSTGFAVTWWLSSDENVELGQAIAINSGTIWGFWNALAIAQSQDLPEGEFQATLVAGQLVGLGLGAVLFEAFEPRSGDVAFTNVVATWATAFTLFAYSWGDPDWDRETTWWSLFAATNIGLLSGSLLTPLVDLSRTRAAIIQAGGILGTATGLGFYFYVLADSESGPAEVGGSATIGAAIGLAVAIASTMDFDDAERDSPTQLTAWPLEGGAALAISARW